MLDLVTLRFSDFSFENDYRALAYQLAYPFHIVVFGVFAALCLLSTADPTTSQIISSCGPIMLVMLGMRHVTHTRVQPLHRAARLGRNSCGLLSLAAWCVFTLSSYSTEGVPAEAWVHGVACTVLILYPMVLKTFGISVLGRLALTCSGFVMISTMPAWLPMSKTIELITFGVALSCGLGLAYAIEYMERLACLTHYKLSPMVLGDEDDADAGEEEAEEEDEEGDDEPVYAAHVPPVGVPAVGVPAVGVPAVGVPVRRAVASRSFPM